MQHESVTHDRREGGHEKQNKIMNKITSFPQFYQENNLRDLSNLR